MNITEYLTVSEFIFALHYASKAFRNRKITKEIFDLSKENLKLCKELHPRDLEKISYHYNQIKKARKDLDETREASGISGFLFN